MSAKIDAILASINKVYGDNTIARATNFKDLQVDRISSGSYFLDYCTGGGFPCGKMIELYGLQSAGKSLIAMLHTAEVQKKGGECIWVDAENAWDSSFASKLGIDVNKIIITQSSIGEPTFDLLVKILDAQPSLIVVDSVAAMIPRADLVGSLEDATMATRARLMSRGLAKLNNLNKKTIIIFINQMRTNIGAYGSPMVRPGGRALPHYAAISVEVKRGDWLEKNKIRIGQEVKFRVTKNKVGIPQREGSFNFYFDGQVDRANEIISLALIHKKISQGGAWYEFQGKKFQGREGLEEEAKSNPEFVKALRKELNV
jgi:recombination protein RecA